jgi:ABC-type ATPase involved in cell division
VLRIRAQIADALADHGMRGDHKKRVHDLLGQVGLPSDVADMYPHELSGGMKQRACIAIAICLRPKVIIADEHHGVVWFEWDLDGRADAMAFFEFADGLITRVTDFWPEPYEPPTGREHLTERW